MAGKNYDDGGPTIIEGTQRMVRLVVEAGPWSGHSFLLDKPSQIVGRAPECDIVLEDREVSRRHTRFFWRTGQLLMEDLGSANGTLVNDVPISGPHVVSPADKIEIGASTLAVLGLPPAAQPIVSPQPMPAAAYAPAPQVAAPAPAQPSNTTLWVLIGGLLLALLIFVLAGAAFWYFRASSRLAAVNAPAVTIVSPPNGVEVPVNVPISVQATASDQQGVVRIELWADGTLVSQQSSQQPGGEPVLLLNIPWTPTIPGNHVLEVRAFNAANQQNRTTLVTIVANAAPDKASPSPATAVIEVVPSATSTPVIVPTSQSVDTLPTATATAVVAGPTATPQPSLRALAGVNVREGPGTVYGVRGVLADGQIIQPLGRSPDGGWWQIIFPPGSGTPGWVAANYVQPNEQALNLPFIAPPPLPPTATFTPPPPATATNIPTVTPSATALPPANISFTVDNNSLNPGECTILRWQVKNVKAYWVDGSPGVGDEGTRQVCDPVGVTTHVLKVQKQDDSVQEFTVSVAVGGGGTVPVPAQVSPDNNKEFDYYPREVTFVWSGVSAPGTVTYNIEIEWYGGISWQSFTRSQGMAATTYTMDNFVGANPGRWRVWATSSTAGDGPKSDWRYFRFLR